eukprot:SAG11_NODE_12334_length_708_cov_1.711002_1_plen_61_part_10
MTLLDRILLDLSNGSATKFSKLNRRDGAHRTVPRLSRMVGPALAVLALLGAAAATPACTPT